MKIYILTKDSTRCFSNGTELHFNGQFISINSDLDTAKRAIDFLMERNSNFKERSSFHGGSVYDREVYAREYVDRRNTDNCDIYRVAVQEIDDIPEVKENEDLKKRVKNLEKEIENLKSKQSGFTTKESFHTEPVEKKEAKSHVKFW